MERITANVVPRKINTTLGYIIGTDDETCAEICSNNESCRECIMQKALNKLTAYEDTGLEPEEVAKLVKKHESEGVTMEENKSEICAKLGELLKLTRAGANIESVVYCEDNDRVYIHDNKPYAICLNTVGDSGAQLIADVVKKILS